MSAGDLRESGTLPVGVEIGGKVHRDFVLRPRMVSDSITALEDPKAQASDAYRGVALTALQIEKLGELTREQITTELVAGMFDIDLGEIMEKASRLESRLRTFREDAAGSAPAAPGAGDGGGSVQPSP